ncbi:MAG TPA: phosphatase PAP2 family protein [Chloroflexota bacterium]|nr:phosphatase PAP2 family protein [Chloroflexota bacterium]
MLGTAHLTSPGAGRLHEAAAGRRWLSFALNAAIMFGLYEIYDLGRGLISRDGTIAVEHADAVWSWEVAHGVFVEPAWQQFWLTRAHILGRLQLTPARVTDFLNTGYLYVHFLGTIGFLIWLFLYRRHLFPFVRNIFFVTTTIALAVYILYPLAPPRLTPNLLYHHHHYVFIDTMQRVVNAKYQRTEIGYNPYAAMPSLHMAWALIIGCTLACTLRFWLLRIVCAGYPVFMLTVIVVSGNHYFADCLGSVGVVGMAIVLVMLWMRWRDQLPWLRARLFRAAL